NMEKLQFMSEGFIQTEYSVPDDYSHLLSVGPFTIAEGDSEVVAFAFVAGESLEEINSQAELAFYMYPGLTQSSEYSNALPDNMILHQNYPNPFNASTTIEFTANQPSSLEIYDLTGRLVRQYDILSAGTNLVSWDGKNDFGQTVVSGVYFYSLSSGGKTKTKKMIYLK
ncbi:MAG TPA: T9SS type A sorting domain-containing protein, partial [candidate division Zixibacteria bacterium]|nr:T9SS type A sorting domain-containing protein [candidate division Zixibacteria bacterium]